MLKKKTEYDIDNIGFFYDNTDIFGATEPILALDKEACAILPKTASFADLHSEITYDTDVPGRAALITYDFHGTQVGSVSLDLTRSTQNSYAFEVEETSSESEEAASPTPSAKEKKTEEKKAEEKEKKTPSFVFINFKTIKIILIVLAVIAVLFGILFFLQRNFQFSFGPGLRSSRNHEYSKKGLKLSRDMQRERKAQIRAAKKRYKERLKRR